MSEKMKTCPTCGKEIAKSAKVCPHCGEKLKMGCFSKGIIAIVVIVAIWYWYGPSQEENNKELTETLDKIAESQAADISPTGELAAIFSLPSMHTDVQRDKAEKEITGKIVQWTLPVYEVKKRGEGYRVQTSSLQILFVPTIVDAFITIYPRNEKEKSYIENLKTGDKITFKGKITGTTMRCIDIEPAILVLK